MKNGNISVGKPSLSGVKTKRITTAPKSGPVSLSSLKGKSTSARGYDAGYVGGNSGPAYATHKGGRVGKMIAKYHAKRGKM